MNTIIMVLVLESFEIRNYFFKLQIKILESKSYCLLLVHNFELKSIDPWKSGSQCNMKAYQIRVLKPSNSTYHYKYSDKYRIYNEHGVKLKFPYDVNVYESEDLVEPFRGGLIKRFKSRDQETGNSKNF